MRAPTLRDAIFYAPILLYILFDVAYSVAQSVCNDGNGNLLIHPASAVLVGEFTKLCISFAFLKYADEPSPFELGKFARYAVPGLIYAINNSIMWFTYLYNPPVVVALFAQFRIIFTAMIYQFIPGRALSLKQWYGVVAVFVGCMVAESHNLAKGFDVDENGATGDAAGKETTLFGLLLILTNAILSCIASVYSEYLLKDMGHTLNWSNVQLYSFGCLFNFFAVVRDREVIQQGVFKGFSNACAIFSIFCFAFMGMTVSAILKKFDSIAKIIGAVFVTLLLTAYSILFAGRTHALETVVGALLVMGGSSWYKMSPKKTVAAAVVNSGLRKSEAGSEGEKTGLTETNPMQAA